MLNTISAIYGTLIGYREIEVNSKDDTEVAFIDFIKKCNRLKNYIKVLIICGNKCCGVPRIIDIKITENEDLDDILKAIKNNNFSEFVKKNVTDKKILDKTNFNSLINAKVEYTMYPYSNEMLITFY